MHAPCREIVQEAVKTYGARNATSENTTEQETHKIVTELVSLMTDIRYGSHFVRQQLALSADGQKEGSQLHQTKDLKKELPL